MPRPLLKDSQNQLKMDQNILRTQAPKQELSANEKLRIDQLLRKPRSKAYMQALRKLDAGGHVQNQQLIHEIMEAIINEFPELSISGLLLGYVSKCYLGEPYEVHTLDLTASIIDHYVKGKALPSGMEKARSLACRSDYELIEVYADCCRAISSDGSVSVVF